MIHRSSAVPFNSIRANYGSLGVNIGPVMFAVKVLELGQYEPDASSIGPTGPIQVPFWHIEACLQVSLTAPNNTISESYLALSSRPQPPAGQAVSSPWLWCDHGGARKLSACCSPATLKLLTRVPHADHRPAAETTTHPSQQHSKRTLHITHALTKLYIFWHRQNSWNVHLWVCTCTASFDRRGSH